MARLETLTLYANRGGVLREVGHTEPIQDVIERDKIQDQHLLAYTLRQYAKSRVENGQDGKIVDQIVDRLLIQSDNH